MHVYVNSKDILIFMYKDNFINRAHALRSHCALHSAKTPAVENVSSDGVLVAGTVCAKSIEPKLRDAEMLQFGFSTTQEGRQQED